MKINKDYMDMMRAGKYNMRQYRKEQEAGQIVAVSFMFIVLIVLVASLIK